MLRRLLLPTACSVFYTAHCELAKDQSKKAALKTREAHLAEVVGDPKYDIVIVGGGCNGAGVLLDASTRGFRCLLLEQHDFGSGASSKSTKLVHGGVRYLQQAFSLSQDSLFSRIQKFKLVKEAIDQRSYLLDNAPHLTEKVQFVLPSTNGFQTAYFYTGMVMYYLLYSLKASSSQVQFNFPIIFSYFDLRNNLPNLSEKYSSGIVYEDGAFNDSRLLLSTILTATDGNGHKMPEQFKPANAVNQAKLLGFIKDENGKIKGVEFKDDLTDKVYTVEARYVVNCTGVWADQLRLLDNPKAGRRIRMVGGSHLTFKKTITNSKYGLCLPSPDGRVLLVVPWLNRVIAGTTETEFGEPTANPTATQQERDWIRNTLHDAIDKVSNEEMMSSEVAHWCGLRPLVGEEGVKNTKDVARTHVIERSASGLLSLMGGKWTIYRKMGQDLVDQICRIEKQTHQAPHPPCQTHHLRLWGWARRDIQDKIVAKAGKAIGMHLFKNYGQHGLEIAQGNLEILSGVTTISQLEWIVKHEMVNSIQDVLLRRTRTAFVDRKVGCMALITVVARIMQVQRGLSDEDVSLLIEDATKKMQAYDFH